MRVSLPGISRGGTEFTFTFAGRTIAAFPGETLAAALTSAGELALRKTAAGDERGLFCGMGVCGECAVLVDNRSRRACMTAAAPGLTVDASPARTSAAPCVGEGGVARRLSCEVLVIGAGPAGLAASLAAAAAGCSVIVVDERSKPGGQFFKQPGEGFRVEGGRLDKQFAEGRSLGAAMASTGATVLSNSTVWSARIERETVVVDVASPDGPVSIDASRMIVAAGAMERPWPMPGWTLPGVMTTGAAQTLLRSNSTAAGRRVLVAGNGPLNFQLADELLRAGVRVLALVEQAQRPGPAHVGALLAMLRGSARLVAAGVGHVVNFARRGTPVLYGHVVIRAEGDGRVERVAVAPVRADGALGAERLFNVDALCIGAGFQPQADLPRALGCAFVWRDGAPAVLRNDEGRTSLPSIFVAGDGGGLGGARAALAQGWLAGMAAARDVAGVLPVAMAEEEARQRQALAAAQRFQLGLWKLFAPRRLTTEIATGDTLLCRCEGVTFGVVDRLSAAGAGRPGEVKRATRLGMGRCQGRYCGPLLAARIAAAEGRQAAETDLFAPRPPFRPMPVAAIAASVGAT